ncbi:MAG: tetratricopeptide repeat protein [Planctomycetes bacterium]|nr:tetratricopeptide repeat protein [Planctomycetota bacterium]
MPRREQLEQLLAADPDDVFLQYALAMSYATEGDAPEAIRRLDDLVGGNPDYVAAWFQKGQLEAGGGNTAAAQVSLTRGIAAARKTGNAHAEGEMTAFLESLA